MILDLAGVLLGLAGALVNALAVATGHSWNIVALMVCFVTTGYFLSSIARR